MQSESAYRREELKSKISCLEEFGEKVLDLHRKGWDMNAIVRAFAVKTRHFLHFIQQATLRERAPYPTIQLLYIIYNMALAEILLRRSLRVEVYEALHKRIIAGEVRPGEWLRQEDIASQLGVSMTPVREALDQLVAAGLAERVPYRGVRVIELTHDEMLDAYGLRILLEPLAARHASEAATPPQVQDLKRLLVGTFDLLRLEDMSRLRELSRQFHAAVFEMCGSPLLARVYEMAANKFPDWMLYEAMFRHPEALTESLRLEQEQHRAIVDAIASYNPEAASRAALDHILSLGKDLETYLGIPRHLIRQKEQQFLDK